VGFQLLFKGVMTIIKGVCDFDIAGSHWCVKVFKLLLHLSAGACTAILLRYLYGCNFLLLKRPFCFGAITVYRVFVEFLFGSLQDFKGGMVNVNKLVNK